ncbi:MAG: Gfo/Idh/MocA family protein [Myxococcota bacterium]
MSPTPIDRPRIALIGCGAIAEAFHLPALARHASSLSEWILVDPDQERAGELAARFGASGTAADYREVLGRIDGAIVAVPHHLHQPISLDCVRRGVSVLCEKPLAEEPDAAREVIEAAASHGAALMVNQTRRLFPASQRVRAWLAEGRLGALRQIDYTMGEPFDWPAATPSYFGARHGGKGVLLDTGAHIVDLVCWWLGGRPELVDYHDDSWGGTEAVADLELALGDCRAHVRLSWLSKLSNRYRIVGERGTIEGGAYDWGFFHHSEGGGAPRKVKAVAGHVGFEEFAARLAENFVDVLRGRAQPLVPASEVLASLEVMDECYARRARFEMPWHNAWEQTAVG